MRILAAILLLISLAACGAEPIYAPDEDVQKYAYSHPGPAKLTLLTVVNKRSGSGAHTALMVNGAQRVIWDPAGTWWNPWAPERNDLHYGMTPLMFDTYVDYHTRETFDTVIQELEVSPEVAALAIREMQAYGAVPKAACAVSTSQILSRLPGFEGFATSYFPNAISRQFGEIPGVTTRRVSDTDSDDNSQKLPDT
ncbi:MAG: hypothetical protein AAGA12_10270 [Pseudomonadota bacterium]